MSSSVPTSSEAGSSSGAAEEQLSVFFNVAGLYQKIVVQDGWFVGDLIKFMAKISANLHPHADVPECNAIRNSQTRKFVALADPATRALVHGNLYDLLYVEKAAGSKVPLLPPLALHDEIQLVFYNNPLGITIKPAGDGTYVVATKKKELNCYRRLTPGMQVVSFGPALLTGMDFREFHTTMANSVFPLTAVFRATAESIEAGDNNVAVPSTPTPTTIDSPSGPEVAPTTASPKAMPDLEPACKEWSSTAPESNQPVPPPTSSGDTFNVPVPVVFHDDGTVESRVRRYRPQSESFSPRNSMNSPQPRESITSATADPVPSATLQDEARLEEGLKSLNEAFYKKKRELNDIVDRIREYTQQLTAVRAAMSGMQLSSTTAAPPLTLDMLERQNNNAGAKMPRKPSSVVSGVSSCTSSILHKATATQPPYTSSRHGFLPPKSRTGSSIASKSHQHLSSSTSVCSLTSTCSIDRMAFKKNRLGKYGSESAATLSGRTKKTSTLNTNAFSSTLQLPSSFSTKGAVIPQAQTPRGSAFLNPKSTTPGVGHYDVKDLTKNVRGGEIGDSDRDLTWS
ncbi:hypothetical protein H310_08557 [Aphanomyces invadans]|uniref:Uncharacterized protein n=1 Tax=Aphanomyces invadans TaxID=157072 RepID=A0A024TYT1_9STRA|nr:hypothetical protein H310_08557 [Aphanomyces invadans]ETV99154.1 hypothetical protein H310_08557 [Aphanomyces invadans]|eukprot:XP_008872582.1 hypothetical protein H310_08557 [Aphanomyces invadans]